MLSGQTPFGIIGCYVDKIPEMNVKFEDGYYILSTSRYAVPEEQVGLERLMTDELDEITKTILEHLKDEGVKSPKAEREKVEFNAIGLGYSGTKTLFTIRAWYKLTV